MLFGKVGKCFAGKKNGSFTEIARGRKKKNQRIPLSTNTFDNAFIADHVSSGLTKQNVGERGEVSRLNTAHRMTATY